MIDPATKSRTEIEKGTDMTDEMKLPQPSDFPDGTMFYIKQFDVPLVHTPSNEWFNWFGGKPHPYDVTNLKLGNNWLAESFEEWVGVVAESMK